MFHKLTSGCGSRLKGIFNVSIKSEGRKRLESEDKIYFNNSEINVKLSQKMRTKMVQWFC